MTRQEMVQAVIKRMEECRAAGFHGDHAIASNVVGIFEDHIQREFGEFGLRMVFEEPDE